MSLTSEREGEEESSDYVVNTKKPLGQNFDVIAQKVPYSFLGQRPDSADLEKSSRETGSFTLR